MASMSMVQAIPLSYCDSCGVDNCGITDTTAFNVATKTPKAVPGWSDTFKTAYDNVLFSTDHFAPGMLLDNQEAHDGLLRLTFTSSSTQKISWQLYKAPKNKACVIPSVPKGFVSTELSTIEIHVSPE